MIIVTTQENKDTSKVDSLVLTINSAKAELDEVTVKQLNKEKELNDVLTRLDFLTSDLDNKIAEYDSTIEKKSLEVNKLNLQVDTLSNLVIDLTEEKNKLSEVINLEKVSVTEKIAEYEKSESKNLKKLTVDVIGLTAEKEKLQSFIEILSMESSENHAVLADLKAQVSDMENTLSGKRQDAEDVDSHVKVTQSMIVKLDKEINTNSLELLELNQIIEDATNAVGVLKKEEGTLTTEVAKLKEDRDAFVLEKFNFAKEKEMFVLKEAFIQEKYNQAGIKY